MQYLGVKSQIARRLAAILEAERSPGGRFVEPFAGAWNVTAAMGSHGPRLANDACQPLVTLAQAWLAGWRPPAEVSEDLYRELKAKQDPADPLTAFVGFGCAFGGKWFGGYARGFVLPGTLIHASQAAGGTEPVNWAAQSERGIERKLSRCVDVRFTCLDFGDLEILPGDLVYADPEYRGTTRYVYYKTPFDHDRFVATAQGWAAIPGVKVFVSEYAAQSDTWEQVAEWPARGKQLNASMSAERLFRVRPC